MSCNFQYHLEGLKRFRRDDILEYIKDCHRLQDTPVRAQKDLRRQMDCECLSFSCFFGYQRVRGMIYWIADEVYHQRPRYLDFLASCRWEHLPLWTCRWERSPDRADNEAEWSCQKPFIIARRRNGAVHHCTALCRRLPFFAVLFSSWAHVHSMSENCQVGAPAS
jgi:hypothetical protein